MKTLLPFIFAVLSVSAVGQSTNYSDRMDHIFGAIDKTKISTGLLKEFGVRLNQVEAYNGMVASHCASTLKET